MSKEDGGFWAPGFVATPSLLLALPSVSSFLRICETALSSSSLSFAGCLGAFLGACFSFLAPKPFPDVAAQTGGKPRSQEGAWRGELSRRQGVGGLQEKEESAI